MSAPSDTKPARRSAKERLIELAKAHVAYDRLKTRTSTAKKKRDALLLECLGLLPLGEWLTRGAYRLKRGESGGGERFSLSAYKTAGHQVTPEMQQHISTGDRYPTLEVKPAK